MSDTGMGAAGGNGAAAREEGAAFLRQGRFAEAAVSLRRATEIDPRDDAAWRLLGGALASTGDTNGALAAFGRAVEAGPGSAKNHYNYAIALQGAGQRDGAKEQFRKALEIDPGYDQASARLAEMEEAASPGFERTMIMESPFQNAAPRGAAAGDVPGPGGNPPPPQGNYPPPQGNYPPPQQNYPPPPSGGYAPPQAASPYTPQPGGGGTYTPQPGATYTPQPGATYPQQPGGDYNSPPVQGTYTPQGTFPPQPGGTYPPQGGGYTPPPVLGPGGAYGSVPGSSVNGTAVLIVALLGALIPCLQILGPIAWVMGNSALNTLNQNPGMDQSPRGLVTAGRIIGMIATGFLVLSVVWFVIAMISSVGGSHRYH